MIHREFAAPKVPELFPAVETETHRLLAKLLTAPKAYEHHVRQCVGASLMLFVFGYKVTGDHDHMVYLVERSVARFSEAAAPGAYIVDFFPKREHFTDWYLERCSLPFFK